MKLNKASFQYMFALLFSVATLFAQNITGTVSGDDGSALAGANVAVEGTDSGASSNQDGSFSISGLAMVHTPLLHPTLDMKMQVLLLLSAVVRLAV